MAAVEEHKPADKRRALGRGLDSLLPSRPRVVSPTAGNAAPSTSTVPPPVVIPSAVVPAVPEPGPELVPPSSYNANAESAAARTRVSEPRGQEILELPLDLIDENPYQTRKTFNEAALSELAESIQANGLAQPIVVRPAENGRYVLVLGERRCRASKLAGKTSVPAIVRQLGNEQAAEMTIVENLQRQDLNCLEQAQAFARLSREFNLTQEQIAKRVGASRESVANYVRLLKLPPGVLELLNQGKLGFSEARVLLEALAHLEPTAVEEMARDAVDRGLTVRELKAKVDALQNPSTHEASPPKPIDPNVKAAESELQRLLGMRVRITDRKGKGTVLIQYRSVEDFDRLLDVMRER
jgi:ParB family transcriptional regulator, chromosome partitioning protein